MPPCFKHLNQQQNLAEYAPCRAQRECTCPICGVVVRDINGHQGYWDCFSCKHSWYVKTSRCFIISYTCLYFRCVICLHEVYKSCFNCPLGPHYEYGINRRRTSTIWGGINRFYNSTIGGSYIYIYIYINSCNQCTNLNISVEILRSWS